MVAVGTHHLVRSSAPPPSPPPVRVPPLVNVRLSPPSPKLTVPVVPSVPIVVTSVVPPRNDSAKLPPASLRLVAYRLSLNWIVPVVAVSTTELIRSAAPPPGPRNVVHRHPARATRAQRQRHVVRKHRVAQRDLTRGRRQRAVAIDRRASRVVVQADRARRRRVVPVPPVRPRRVRHPVGKRQTVPTIAKAHRARRTQRPNRGHIGRATQERQREVAPRIAQAGRIQVVAELDRARGRRQHHRIDPVSRTAPRSPQRCPPPPRPSHPCPASASRCSQAPCRPARSDPRSPPACCCH